MNHPRRLVILARDIPAQAGNRGTRIQRVEFNCITGTVTKVSKDGFGRNQFFLDTKPDFPFLLGKRLTLSVVEGARVAIHYFLQDLDQANYLDVQHMEIMNERGEIIALLGCKSDTMVLEEKSGEA